MPALCYMPALCPRLQALILAAKPPADGRLFASKVKEVHTECCAMSRNAITDSSMVTLPNTIRRVAPKGYTLWSALARVHLEPRHQQPRPWRRPRLSSSTVLLLVSGHQRWQRWLRLLTCWSC